MRKIDGLKFLQKNFPDLTVDCLFVDKVEPGTLETLTSENREARKEDKRKNRKRN